MDALSFCFLDLFEMMLFSLVLNLGKILSTSMDLNSSTYLHVAFILFKGVSDARRVALTGGWGDLRVILV